MSFCFMYLYVYFEVLHYDKLLTTTTTATTTTTTITATAAATSAAAAALATTAFKHVQIAAYQGTVFSLLLSV